MSKPRFKYTGCLRQPRAIRDELLGVLVMPHQLSCSPNYTTIIASGDGDPRVWVRAPLGRSLLCLVRV